MSRSYPDGRFRMLAATANDTRGVARIEIVGPRPAAVCEEIRVANAVTDLTVLERDDAATSVQVETTVPLLLTPLQDAGIPLEMPFELPGVGDESSGATTGSDDD